MSIIILLIVIVAICLKDLLGSGLRALVIGLVPKIVFTSKFLSDYRTWTVDVEGRDDPIVGCLESTINSILFCYTMLTYTGVVASSDTLREYAFSFTPGQVAYDVMTVLLIYCSQLNYKQLVISIK